MLRYHRGTNSTKSLKVVEWCLMISSLLYCHYTCIFDVQHNIELKAGLKIKLSFQLKYGQHNQKGIIKRTAFLQYWQQDKN